MVSNSNGLIIVLRFSMLRSNFQQITFKVKACKVLFVVILLRNDILNMYDRYCVEI